MANLNDLDEHVDVPDFLQKGAYFQLCQDVFTSGLQSLQRCLIKVDQHGFFLIWRNQEQEAQLLDCSQIREICNNGYQVKDQKAYTLLESQVRDGTVSDRLVVIVCGADMVNYSTFQFLAEDAATSKKWIAGLRKLIHNPLQRNISFAMALKKSWMKLCFSANKNEKISVKSIARPFSSGRNSKAAFIALKEMGFPNTKNDLIDLKEFTFEKYYQLYKQSCNRTDLSQVFNNLIGGARCSYVEIGSLAQWMNSHQRDPRLNEILDPMYDHKRTKRLIKKHEPDPELARKGRLTLEGFSRYLSGLENSSVFRDRLTVFEDMDQPLCHYSINSSHNTYLNGRQFIGDSSVDMYRQVLLSGCRCIELDCWDGKGENQGEPIVTHGKAMCTDVNFIDVIHAINETAFVVSDYPVILSFENHCSKPQQLQLAKYCEEVFGDKLLRKPLEDCPLDPGIQLPSPNALKGKIIIKNKRLKTDVEKAQLERYYKHEEVLEDEEEQSQVQEEDSSSIEEAHPELARLKSNQSYDENQSDAASLSVVEEKSEVEKSDIEIQKTPVTESLSKGDGQGAKKDTTITKSGKSKSKKGQPLTEEDEKELLRNYKYVETSATNIHPVLSSFINYCQSVKFQGFEYAEEQKLSYQMSSFSESVGIGLLKTSAIEFVNYNKRQLSRIYPRGNRVDSSNYMPQVFWNAGCQMVSLNFQTSDLNMQLNQGRFEFNGMCGYLLKPEFMRRDDRVFDPFSESPVDGVIAAHCSVEVIAGMFLSDKQIGTYVEVDMYGLPTDTIRKEHRTKLVPSNGLDPVYNSPPFVFRKVVLPTLALIRFAVHDESGKLIGQRVIPLEALQCGYRYIALRSAGGQMLDPASLFVNIVLKSYVPDKYINFVDAVSNPKRYLSLAEERATSMRNMGIDEDDLNDSNGKLTERLSATSGGMASREASKHKHVSQSDSEKKLSFHTSRSDSGFTNIATRRTSENNGSETRTRSLYLSSTGQSQQQPVNDLMQRTPVTVEMLKQDAAYLKLVASQTKEIQRLKNKMMKECQTFEKKHKEKLNEMLISLENSDRVRSNSLCCFAPKLRAGILSEEDFKTRLNALHSEDREKVLSFQKSQKEVETSCIKTYKDTLSRINEHHQKQQIEALELALKITHQNALETLKEAQEKEMSDLAQRQTKSSMHNTREISSNKTIKKAEKDRQIREISSTNAKKFVEKRQMLSLKHTRQFQKIQSQQDGEVEAVKNAIKSFVATEIKERHCDLENGNHERVKQPLEAALSDNVFESTNCSAIVE
ncbi:1-phosphatidylinositol 4,5-bisphosphate phosphodiesterase beta-4-like [Styela clava]